MLGRGGERGEELRPDPSGQLYLRVAQLLA